MEASFPAEQENPRNCLRPPMMREQQEARAPLLDLGRARESSVQRLQRLAQQNLRTSVLRARESRLERSQRLHEQNVRTSQLRKRESSVERLQRLRAQAERQQWSKNRVFNRISANSNRLAFRYDAKV
ncbi:hypothetical protein J6590_075910 [Homalodisca vitripennis]|nr:hypothetical protein J6590_075910 [Homalodisca vitripennis]